MDNAVPDTVVLGDELFDAMQNRTVVEPLTVRHPDITVDQAYAISERFLERRLAAGERVIGRKIGLTSKAVQEQLGVDQPDFGNLTDAMFYPNGAEVPVSRRLIQPKAEGEIAFVLGKDIAGPEVSIDDVLDATEYVTPCFEIVDSRVRDWAIRLQDTIADNASCGLFVVGDDRADPGDLDLSACEMVIRTDGEVVATGLGSAALGSPLVCVAWLADVLARYGVHLRKGDVVLSGSLGPFVPCEPGSEMQVTISGIGETSVRFT